MTRYLSEDRAPLEFTKPSKKQKVVGCPYCKKGRSVSINWVAGICSGCNSYFSIDMAIDEKDCDNFLNQNVPVNKEFTNMKAKMEKDAYEYKEKVLDKKKQGKLRKHEPGGDDGYW